MMIMEESQSAEVYKLLDHCCNYEDGMCLLLGMPCPQRLSLTRINCIHTRFYSGRYSESGSGRTTVRFSDCPCTRIHQSAGTDQGAKRGECQKCASGLGDVWLSQKGEFWLKSPPNVISLSQSGSKGKLGSPESRKAFWGEADKRNE